MLPSFFWSKGRHLNELGRTDEAGAAFDRAIAFAHTPAEAAHVRLHLDHLITGSQPRTTATSQ